MWLATKYGWFSIVKDPSVIPSKLSPGLWMVRARVRKDIENVCTLLRLNFEDEIIQTQDSDYEFRILIDLVQLEELFQKFAFSIDYPNFKDMIDFTPDQKDKHAFYNRVWLLGMQYLSQTFTLTK